MTLLEMDLDEKYMLAMIKDLLSLNDGRKWLYRTEDVLIAIKFNGNNFNVMKGISEWLNVPERKRLIETLGDTGK
jgi:hypothetical protein